WTCRRASTPMKSRKSEAKSGPKVGTVGGTVRPLLATIKQALVTMPGINRLIPGGRKPVTHLYPYQKVELPVAFRGQHSIDWFKCIGCELCAKVCPNECIYFEVDVCIGCRKCERECPTRCIDMLDGPNDRKGKPIVIPEFDYTKCIGCQQCVDVCPVDCLHMEEIGYKDLEGFYHINLQGEVKLLEEQVEK